jgi:hypothetical protein
MTKLKGLLRPGDDDFLSKAMKDVKDKFLYKRTFFGTKERERYRPIVESMESAINRIFEMNQELEHGSSMSPQEVLTELESLHKQVLNGMAALQDKTNDPKKKVVLLKYLTTLVETSAFPISTIKRHIAATKLNAIKAQVQAMEGYNRDAFKAFEATIPVTIPSPRLSPADFESIGKTYAQVEESFKASAVNEDMTALFRGGPIAIQLVAETVSTLQSDGLKANAADSFQLGTNMLTHNFAELAFQASDNRGATDIVLRDIPQHLSDIKMQNLDVEIAALERKAAAYQQYATTELGQDNSADAIYSKDEAFSPDGMALELASTSLDSTIDEERQQRMKATIQSGSPVPDAPQPENELGIKIT